MVDCRSLSERNLSGPKSTYHKRIQSILQTKLLTEGMHIKVEHRQIIIAVIIILIKIYSDQCVKMQTS